MNYVMNNSLIIFALHWTLQCEIKIDSNIKQLYNLAGFNLITNNNQLNKGRLALYIKSNIPVTIKPEQTFIRNGVE